MKYFTRRALGLVAALAVVATSTGCLFNQQEFPTGPLEMTPSLGSLEGKTIVVAGVYDSPRKTSITHSADIIQLKEAVALNDMSAKVAGELRRRGFRTKAMVDVNRREIGADEVLLRGVIVHRWVGDDFAHMLTFLASFGMFGGMVPSPVFFDTGFGFKYRFELFDHEGNILLDDEGIVDRWWDSAWVWTHAKRTPEDRAELEKRIFDALAEALRA